MTYHQFSAIFFLNLAILNALYMRTGDAQWFTVAAFYVAIGFSFYNFVKASPRNSQSEL